MRWRCFVGCLIPEKQLITQCSVNGDRGDGPMGKSDSSSWGTPVALSVTTEGADHDPTLTGDMLELYFNRNSDIYVTTRASLLEPWGTPGRVAELSTAANESTNRVSLDGLAIYFSTDAATLYEATRS